VLITDQLDLPVAIGVAALPTRRLVNLQVGLDVGAPSEAWRFLPGASPGRGEIKEDLS